MSAGLSNLPESQRIEQSRHLARTDLFFLLGYICGRDDVWNHPKANWLITRCRDVETDPNGTLDLWAREHYKSTIITFALTMQDILSSHGDDPDPKWGGREVTIGIFSHTRPISKGFLRQIKQEFESNELLKSLFPDILYSEPKREAPKWSEDDGLVVKRKSNPKESTVEAHGLVDGQPTSKHFFIRCYDDIVTLESVRSTSMIVKTTDSLEMSYNLGVEGGFERFTGTRYRYNDTYNVMLKRGIKTRVNPCYPSKENGKQTGKPVLQTQEYLDAKRRKMGPYVFACQMLLNPKADEVQGFKKKWLRHYKPYETDAAGIMYIIVDPANEKKKKSDYTAGWGLEACIDQKLRARDILRDRLNLTERTKWLIDLHKKYTALGLQVRTVGYEKYGKDSDIQHIESVMRREGYEFEITPLGGPLSKEDRIRRLIPVFKRHALILPEEYYRPNYEGRNEDLVNIFVEEEYEAFPILGHDDMLDSLARIEDEDMDIVYPRPTDPLPSDEDTFDIPLPTHGSGKRQFVF